MPKPLQFGDPGELGPFRLESRLHESAAGIVYLGADPQGRPVEVALLTAAAAGDAAARDRFRAAVAAEAPRAGSYPRMPPAPGPGDPAPVVAALAEGGAPWVATAHEAGHPGAERFLKPVLLERGWGLGGRRRGGPTFQQYWLSGPKGPALHTPTPEPVAAPAAAESDSKGLAAAVLSLAALLVLLAVLVLLLFSCEPSDQGPPRPTDLPTTAPLLPPPPSEPAPTPSSPSPRPSHKGSKTPRPTPTNGDGTINPALHLRRA